jgi:Amidohydrolase family
MDQKTSNFVYVIKFAVLSHIEELFWEFVDLDRNRHFNNENEWMAYVIGETFQQFEPYLNSNIQKIEQALFDKMAWIAKKIKSKNIPVCTTLFLDDLIVEKLFKPEVFLLKPENKYLPRNYLDAFRQGREKHQMQFRGGEAFAPFKRKVDQMLLYHLNKAKVPLILATDAGSGGMGLVPGFSLHQELRILVQNGFTPYEAIKTATVNASNVVKNMTGKDDFGTIEKGKRADLILVKKNPLTDIKFLSSPQGVMASGRWYDKTSLKRMITPGIPVMGAVHHVHEADDKSSTYFEIVIGKNFKNKLPNAITSIAIVGPKGKLAISKDNFTYSPGIRDFWIKIPGIPKKGTYKFEVKSNKNSGSTFDYQHSIRVIPKPDSTTFKPKTGATLFSTTPTFTWAPAKIDIPVYYRLEINRLNGPRVYSTKRLKNMLSHKITHGILKKGQSYRWRLRITDSDDWLNVQNRSHTVWQMFHIR